MQIQRAGLRPSKIRYIFISHLHGDHFFGLPGFLTSQQMQGRSSSIQIFAPRGLRQFIGSIKQLTRFEPDYPLEITEARHNKAEKWDLGDAVVDAKWLDHTIPILGFRYQEKPKPGKFDVAKAERLGIPEGPMRRMLQNGQQIVLPNGTTVLPEHVIGPSRAGKVLAYCTDTRPCQAGIELAHKANLLIHEGTFDAGEEQRAEQTGHSTVDQAAMIASQAKVKKLVLTHFSARYSEDDESRILINAQRVFSKTILASDLRVINL